MLLPGERQLADQLLKITGTARDQEATIPEQGKILHEMSKLYLKDAIETGDGEQFVKASALINAALVRTEDPNDQKKLQELLFDVYKGLIKNIGGTTFGFSVGDIAAKASSNKDYLHDIRFEVNDTCKRLDQFFESYSMIDSADPVLSEDGTLQFRYYSSKPLGEQIQYEKELEIVKVVKEVNLEVQKKMLDFVKTLWTQAIEMCGSVVPPCDYSVIGLGSLARQEITPYSDLEFALLVETDSNEIKQYFRNLVYLFHLLVLDLGESPIPGVAIESLNDYLSLGGDTFFDIVTPRGFRMDGAMPWACKTPIGRKQTPQREALDLIKTPEEMAALLREDNVLGQAYRVADILCNCILIFGDSQLFDNYIAFRDMTLSKTDNKEKARRSLIEDYDRSPDWSIKRISAYNLQSKQFFYRFPSTFVENLRMYFTPLYQPNSNWEILDHLSEANILSINGAFNLKVQLAICNGLRLLTYLKNRGQYESFEVVHVEEKPFEKVRSKNPFTGKSSCRLAYFGNIYIQTRLHYGCNGIRYAVEKYFIDRSYGRVADLQTEEFFEVNQETQPSLRLWSRSSRIFGNLGWARTSKELPPKGCGSGCGTTKLCILISLSKGDPAKILKAISEIMDFKDCKCLSLVKTSLLVSKACLMKRYNLIGTIPQASVTEEKFHTYQDTIIRKEADISDLMTRYKLKRYKNVRERFYLLLDISDLAVWIMDKTIMFTVTEMIEAFFIDIPTFGESQQIMVNMMKHKLVLLLISFYRETGQFEKGMKLCQQQIDEAEMTFGVGSFHHRIGTYCYRMGNLQLECGLSSEALKCYQIAFDIRLQVHYLSLKGLKYELQEDRLVRKSNLQIFRRLALTMAELYQEQKSPEQAIEVLAKALTKDGKSFDIETDDDILALRQLCMLCNTFGEVFLENQFFEELLKVVIDKGQGHKYRPYTVMELVSIMHFWVFRLGFSEIDCRNQPGRIEFFDGLPPSHNSSYIIENIYRKYLEENPDQTNTKQDFLIDIVCKLVGDESLQKYYIERTYLTNAISAQKGEFVTWCAFFFTVCQWSVHKWDCIDVPMEKVRIAMLQQAEIFCDKVVKKIASESIYKMCLILIDFHRIRTIISEYLLTKDSNNYQLAVQLSVTLKSQLLQHFPFCRTAIRVVNELKSVDRMVAYKKT